MFRRDVIIAVWFCIPLVLHITNISLIDSSGKTIMWLISDVLIMSLLVLPEVIKPKGGLAKWLTTRIFHL